MIYTFIIQPNGRQGKRQSRIVFREVMKMANSLLLRGDAGRMDGYVQRSANTLRCRVTHGAARGTRLFVCFADGQVCEFSLSEGNGEQLFPAPEGALSGACVVTGDIVVCATDASAREMGWMALRAAESAAQRPALPVPEPPDDKEEPEKQPLRSCKMESCMPEMRWPPPPCLASARYDGGRWVNREEEATADAAPDRDAH